MIACNNKKGVIRTVIVTTVFVLLLIRQWLTNFSFPKTTTPGTGSVMISTVPHFDKLQALPINQSTKVQLRGVRVIHTGIYPRSSTHPFDPSSKTPNNDEQYPYDIDTEGAQEQERKRSRNWEKIFHNATVHVQERQNQRRKRNSSHSQSDRTGVILFLHAPKTGGTSLRELYRTAPNMSMRTCLKRSEFFQRWTVKIEQYLTRQVPARAQKSGLSILFLELHDDYPGIFTLHPWLTKWRQQADQHQTMLTVMTLFRNPIDYYLSYFNFFHRQKKKQWAWAKQYLNATDENLLHSALPNHQCAWLVRDGMLNDLPQNPLTAQECLSGFLLALKHMDWIGQTDELNEQTLPFLSHLLRYNHSAAAAAAMVSTTHKNKTGMVVRNGSVVAFNVNPRADKMTVQNLRPETISALRDKAWLDDRLYHAIPKFYPNWRNV